MNCPARPVGIGPMLRKFKKPLRPNTRETSPSRMRAIKVTIFIRVSFRSFQNLPMSRQLIEKEINGCDPAVSGDNEISSGERWLLTRAALYPSDAPGIAQFLGLANWLISKVCLSSPDRARDAIDLVATMVDAPAGVVEYAIFGEDLVDR